MFALFVDDDPDDYEIFCEALAVAEPVAKTIRANDGYTALILLKELVVKPDIIFLDINMPVMDGKEFLKIIKKDLRFKDIPVVMYTTSSAETEKKNFERLGAVGYIVKPNDFFSLVESLRNSVQRRKT